MSRAAEYMLLHDHWEYQEHEADEPEVPIPLALGGLLLHWHTAQALGWAEHTGDWDFHVIINTFEGEEYTLFGNPDLHLVYKGEPIETKNLAEYFLDHNFNDPEVQQRNVLDPNPRYWELKVEDWTDVGSQDEEPTKTFINLAKVARIDIGWD